MRRTPWAEDSAHDVLLHDGAVVTGPSSQPAPQVPDPSTDRARRCSWADRSSTGDGGRRHHRGGGHVELLGGCSPPPIGCVPGSGAAGHTHSRIFFQSFLNRGRAASARYRGPTINHAVNLPAYRAERRKNSGAAEDGSSRQARRQQPRTTAFWSSAGPSRPGNSQARGCGDAPFPESPTCHPPYFGKDAMRTGQVAYR
jgi:hypothetical protein